MIWENTYEQNIYEQKMREPSTEIVLGTKILFINEFWAWVLFFLFLKKEES